MGLQTGIWALRLGFEGGREEKEEEEREIIPHMCESRGHPPLRLLPCFPFYFQHNLPKQGTGTADHLMLL